MAFLKETERSLRLYFIVVGALATILALVGLRRTSETTSVTLPALVTLAIWFPLLARLVLGPAFMIAGIKLKGALETGAHGTMRLVKVAAAVVVAEVLLGGAAVTSLSPDANAAEAMGESIGRTIVPLLILWYIHSSLRRLADESRRRIVNTVADKFV